MNKIKTTKTVYKDSYQPIDLNIWEPSLNDWREIIADYNWILKNRFNNKMAMFKVQLGIVSDLDLCQKNIKMYKDIKQKPSNIKKYTDQEVDTTEKSINHSIHKERVLINAFKDIMDGHLWRIFNYNRALIYVLGSQPGITYLNTDKGGFNEIFAWGNNIVDSDNTHFLINNLTNSAKIGDLLSKSKEGTISLSEIKSSTLSSGTRQKIRQQKQESRRKNFEYLANNGEGEVDGKNCKIINVPNGYTNKLIKFKRLLKTANRKGISNLNLNNYLYITCVDHSFNISKNIIEKSFKKHLKILSNQDDIIIPLNSGIRSKYSPKFIPFSIYPISDDIIADLLLGKKTIFYSLNVSKILQNFTKNGWTVISTFKDHLGGIGPETPFCTVKKNQINIDVPWTTLNQIIFELRDIKSIITEFNYILNITNENNIRLLSKYEDDSKIWS